MSETRECLSCKKTPGLYVREAFSYGGSDYPEHRKPCHACNGVIHMPKPDAVAIAKTLKGRKGLRTTRPADRRAYFVWRMARFHGGKDVTLPMTASMEISGDPWRAELDYLAGRIARAAFGTDMAGASRWSPLTGGGDQDIKGLPPSAYPCGPVADIHKPEEEYAEMF